MLKLVVLEKEEAARLAGRANNGLQIEEKSGTIVLDGQPVEEKFTTQEYLLLKMFLEMANRLCTRDDVGEALWGKDSYEKYSDWAIDQIISKLRKKLENLRIKDRLITLRGRGYKFTTL